MAGYETSDERPPVVVPDRRYGFPDEAFDPSLIPDVDTDFLPKQDLEAFIAALSAPDPTQNHEDVHTFSLASPVLSHTSFDFTRRTSLSLDRPPTDADPAKKEAEDAQAVAAHAAAASGDVGGAPEKRRKSLFITAQNDWAPVHEKVPRSCKMGKRTKRSKAVRQGLRTVDETREGYSYGLLKWPFLMFVTCWLMGLSVAYMLTRFYIWCYEQFIAWRGHRETLRKKMRATADYKQWRAAARDLDAFFGNSEWKEHNEFAYYDYKTVRRVWDSMKKSRERAQTIEKRIREGKSVEEEERQEGEKAVDALRALLTACVKHDFVGVENPRLYSQTYYGTKNLVQNHVDEVERSLRFVLETKQMAPDEKRELFKALYSNYGRTALCLSGGATLAYHHFGVCKALLEEDLLPDVITGTSGGALVAALVATRTNEELKKCLTPALAYKITACSDPFLVWARRWYSTGARFNSVDWASKSAWFTHGSMTFREAYERTGRILNVSCVPADPHSPTMLCNYLTSPDCVVWSAVLASAAVPGVLNPVVLMMKQRDGTLAPYSFGHKWKDGSLRTDIPVKALNLHFNVNFTIVSQVNPHISLFFFSSRGSVGQPVTHRRGRGWRGGFVGTAVEQYIKLDLTKWLKVLRQLELLPRLMGQDWSHVWLQQGFGGTITIWPRSKLMDFARILTDPTPARLARMIHEGQQSAFPTVKFVANRLKIERLVERGRRETRGLDMHRNGACGGLESLVSEDDLRSLLRGSDGGGGGGSSKDGGLLTASSVTGTEGDETTADEAEEVYALHNSAVVEVKDEFASPDDDDDDDQTMLEEEGAEGGEDTLLELAIKKSKQ